METEQLGTLANEEEEEEEDHFLNDITKLSTSSLHSSSSLVANLFSSDDSSSNQNDKLLNKSNSDIELNTINDFKLNNSNNAKENTKSMPLSTNFKLTENMKTTNYNKKEYGEGSNFISKMLISWIFPIIYKGYTTPLEFEHLYKVPPRHSCNVLSDTFQELLTKQRAVNALKPKKVQKNKLNDEAIDSSSNTSASVWCCNTNSSNSYSKVPLEERGNSSDEDDDDKQDDIDLEDLDDNLTITVWDLLFILMKLNKARLGLAIIFGLISLTLSFSIPVVTHSLLTSLESASIWHNVSLGFLLAVITITQSMFWTHMTVQLGNMNQNSATALSAAVFLKTLRIAKQSGKGDVVTLMSVDARRIGRLSWHLNMAWFGPITLFVSFYLIFRLVGVVAVGIIIVWLILAPINAYLMKKFDKLQDSLMNLQEGRVKKVSEILQGILVIKLFNWETDKMKGVNNFRDKELVKLRLFMIILALINFTFICASTFMSSTIFISYGLLGNDLTPNIVFPVFQILGISSWVVFDLPASLAACSESYSSGKRVAKFLSKKELSQRKKSTTKDYHHGAVNINNASFQWPKAQSVTLDNITLNVKPGELIAVVGEVGAGKSTLLSAILGEVDEVDTIQESEFNKNSNSHSRRSSSIECNGSVAYVPQEAWIRNTTLRNNIICEQQYDKEKYHKVLKACALLQDVKMLPAGSNTEIGEQGVNLSGGQKQRVNIARALYASKDIILLDDPLSAVDAHVGKHLFEKCICKAMNTKTRILVTHQLQFIPKVDRVVIMDRGKIKHVGTYNELIQKPDVSFSSLLASSTPNRDDLLKSSADTNIIDLKESYDAEAASNDGGTLIEDEEREVGSVRLSVYKSYLLSFGKPILFFYLLAIILSQIFGDGQNLWLAIWTGNFGANHPIMSIVIFLSLGLSRSIFVLIRQVLLAFGCWKAARKLHSNMLASVLAAPISFFHTTPQGRILNRFSKDTASADTDIPDLVSDAFSCVFYAVGKLVTVLISVPMFIIVFIPVMIVFYALSQVFRTTSRELKRLQSISNSPIYAHFDETLDGLDTIRAYDIQKPIIFQSVKRINKYVKTQRHTVMADRWLGIMIGVISAFVLLSTALLAITGCYFSWVSPSFAGLAIVSASGIAGSLSWLVRVSCRLEAEMSKVERIINYSELTPEAAHQRKRITTATSTGGSSISFVPIPNLVEPSSDWPTDGNITYEQVVMSYRPNLPPALNGISFQVNSGEKIGVVGRTGAGKSSLMLTLFRIVETTKGRIIVDGIDIAKMDMAKLRQRLSIIPQDAMLFSGSLRSNLDPTFLHSDLDIWQALEQVNLKRYVLSLKDQLAFEVAENGKNLSLGQRCLARALLKKTKILVMDEATASVDTETDEIIQNTVRQQFKHCTVMTIAHRLPTIIDYDKVMVLDAGKVVEFDSAANLLKNNDGIFTSLVNNTGEASSQFLKEMAAKGTPLSASHLAKVNAINTTDNNNNNNTDNDSEGDNSSPILIF